MLLLLTLFGLIAIIIGIIFLIKNSQTSKFSKFSNNCKKLCHDIFKNIKGATYTYETACKWACNHGINLNKQEQCKWCATQEAPMSGFNKVCQKYINLNQDKKPNNIYKSECCGKGGYSPWKSQC